MKQYDLIVFDWDGTLMDSTQHIINCMQLGIEQLSLPPLSDRTVSNIMVWALMKLWPPYIQT